MSVYETAVQRVDLRGVRLSGRVLDIGGGGEGVISRLSGENVVAIDRRPDELAETPDIGLKIVMDACDLKFLDGYFDHVTCFYTLLYMGVDEIGRFLNEARRVLKHNGLLWVWDTAIPEEATADAFVAQVEVRLTDTEMLTPGYGVAWQRGQSGEMIQQMAESAGFTAATAAERDEAFKICLRKR